MGSNLLASGLSGEAMNLCPFKSPRCTPVRMCDKCDEDTIDSFNGRPSAKTACDVPHICSFGDHVNCSFCGCEYGKCEGPKLEKDTDLETAKDICKSWYIPAIVWAGLSEEAKNNAAEPIADALRKKGLNHD